MYMSALLACTPLCQKRAVDPITDGCEPSRGCWELNSGPLEEQPALLTTEPSLQPSPCSCFVNSSLCFGKEMYTQHSILEVCNLLAAAHS